MARGIPVAPVVFVHLWVGAEWCVLRGAMEKNLQNHTTVAQFVTPGGDEAGDTLQPQATSPLVRTDLAEPCTCGGGDAFPGSGFVDGQFCQLSRTIQRGQRERAKERIAKRAARPFLLSQAQGQNDEGV